MGNEVSSRDPGDVPSYVESMQRSSSEWVFWAGLNRSCARPRKHGNFFLNHGYPAVATTNERATPPTPPPCGMFSWPGWVGRVLVRGERRALGIFQIGGKRVHTRARDKQAEEEGEHPESGRRGAHSHPRRTALVRCAVLRSTRTCRG